MAYTEQEDKVFGVHREKTLGHLSDPEKAQVHKLIAALRELPELGDQAVDPNIQRAVDESFVAQATIGPVNAQVVGIESTAENTEQVASQPNGIDSAMSAEQTRAWLEGLQAA